MSTAWDQQWLHDTLRQIDEPRVWRGVETQYASATTLLVDTGDEHDLLEQMLETSKPPYPAAIDTRKHYLLTTPFRYTPETASRFRSARQRGVWYGARQLRAACAEVAYWRMTFIVNSVGLRKGAIVTRHTFFAAHVATARGIDLTIPPWVAARAAWTSGQDYAETLSLAEKARAAGVEVIQYESVRSPGDTNFAVFTPSALEEPTGGLDASQQAWTCSATKDRAIMWLDNDASTRLEWTC